MDVPVILLTTKGYEKFIFFITCLLFSIPLQIFLVTGGSPSPTTSVTSEILVDVDKPWRPLSQATLVRGLYGLRLATINNEVFCLGTI